MTGATQTQIRRDTAANILAATPAAGELAADLTNNRINLGDGARAGGWQMPNFADIQKNNFTWASAVGGAANAIMLTYSPTTLADSAGSELNFLPASPNTGATTVSVDTRTAVTVKKFIGGTITDLAANDLLTTCPAKMIKAGSYYILLNPNVAPSSGALMLLDNQNVSGVASVIFGSSFINSTYDKYILEYDSVTTSDGGTLALQIFSSGSYLTSGYPTGNLWGNSSNKACTGFPIINQVSVSNAAAYVVIQGTVKFSNPSATQRPVFEWSFTGGGGSGSYTTGTGLTFSGIKILDGDGGNISGNFNLYGIQN